MMPSVDIQGLLSEVRTTLTARLAADEPLGEIGAFAVRLEQEAARRERIDDELTVDFRRLFVTTAPGAIPDRVLDRPLPVGIHPRASAPMYELPISAEEASRGIAISYRSANITFYRGVIERLRPGELFRVVTQHGTFEIPGDQFETAFPDIARSRSYREGPPSAFGSCRYVVGPPPAEAEPFRVKP